MWCVIFMGIGVSCCACRGHRFGCCLSAQVDAMAATQTNHRRMLAADSQPSGRRDPSQQQRQTGPGQLPSGNSTAPSLPRLSEECYRLAVLAHTPQYERSPDFAAAAYSLLQGSLGRVQDATGLQTLRQDSTTGQVAVSLTGEEWGTGKGCAGEAGGVCGLDDPNVSLSNRGNQSTVLLDSPGGCLCDLADP
jgi:hypothetical protein